MELSPENRTYLIDLTWSIVVNNIEEFNKNRDLILSQDSINSSGEGFVEYVTLLNGAGIIDLDRVVKSLSKKSDLLSSDLVEYCYKKMLFNLLSHEETDKAKIENHFDEFLSTLDKFGGNINIYFPIYGLKLENLDNIKIGPINIISYTTMMGKVKDKIDAYLDSIENSEARDKRKKGLEEEILPSFIDKACVEVTTKGEFSISQQPARIYAQSMIDVLRIYLPIIRHPYIYGIKISIEEKDYFEEYHSFSLYTDHPYNLCSATLIKGRTYYYSLSNENLELMRKNHLDDLINAMIEGAASKSKFNRRIFQAAKWISIGIDEDENNGPDKVLKLAIGLECLLINENTCITEKLAERCALVQRLNFEDRIKMFNDIKRFYDLRSKIVHEGLDKIDFREVRDFQLVVVKTLLSVIYLKKKYQWDEFEELITWIKEQKFSTPAGA